MIDRNFEQLWNKYTNIIEKLEDENINNLIEDQGQRIIEASYSLKEKEPFCGIGGVVEFMLELASTAKKLDTALGYEVSSISILKCCLLSEIGRIGTFNDDRLVENKSEWHKEKLGLLYDWNEACCRYDVYDMTLWYCQKYNISLTWDEWQAIYLLKGRFTEESKFYNTHKSRLGTLLSLSKEVVIKNEIDKINLNYTVPF
mgnify:CR=1 FL=1